MLIYRTFRSSVMEETKGTVNKYGVVIYSDGGARPNPGYGGWGIHGYLYKKNDDITKPVVDQKYYLTTEGYLSTHIPNNKNELIERDMSFYPKIELVKYINGFGSFSNAITNNYAELVAAVEAINTTTGMINPTLDGTLENLTIVCDSEYAIKAIEKDLSGLIKSDWKTPDGKEIKNKAVLEEIHGAKSDLQKQNITLKCNWVKGHSGNPGNEYSDWNATSGVFLSTRNKASYSNEVILEDTKTYWKTEDDRHPLLFLRRCYFMSTTDTDKPAYVMGEHGKRNSYFMFPRSETVLSIVYLPKVNNTIKTIMDHQLKFLGGSEYPNKKNLFISKTKFSIDMLSLYNKFILRSIKAFGTQQFYIKNANNIGLVHANKESIVDELNPQFLGFQYEDKVNHVEDLYNIIFDMKKHNKDNVKLGDKQISPEEIFILQDLTSVFYHTVEEKMKHKPNPINTLVKKHFITRETKSIQDIKSVKDKEKLLEAFNGLDEQEEIQKRIEEIKWIEDNPTHQVSRYLDKKISAEEDEEGKSKEVHEVRGLYYDTEGIVKDFLIKLNSNLDLPNRNTLVKIEEMNPKIYLLSWREDKVCKHCIAMELNDGSSAIYHNVFGNRLVILDGIMK